MKNKREIPLYEINENVRCLKCKCAGAVKSYGVYSPDGIVGFENMGEIAKKIYNKYENSPYMSNAMGFGGTIPWRCLNCGNTGLVDTGGLEGYNKAFELIDVKED